MKLNFGQPSYLHIAVLSREEAEDLLNRIELARDLLRALKPALRKGAEATVFRAKLAMAEWDLRERLESKN